jgi:putative ABC transport system permease protein
MLHDLRFAWRSVRSAPVHALFVVLALTSGIGLNAAFFTIVNALLLRPLPYERPGELVEIETAGSEWPLDAARDSKVFSGMGAYRPQGMEVEGPRGTKNEFGFRATAGLFTTLGVRAAIGRTFHEGEDRQGARPVVILAYDYWRSRSGDPSILGTSLVVNGVAHEVIGVLPPDFGLFFRDAKLVVPYPLREGRVIARRAPGVSLAEASAAVDRMIPWERPLRRRVIPLEEAFRTNEAPVLLLVQTAVVLVLLITCANIASMTLARSADRSRELAIRSAMGAERWRLLRQPLIESAILAMAGGIAGVGLAAILIRWLGSGIPANLTRVLRGEQGLTIDLSVAAFTFALSAMAMLFCGLGPALASTRPDLMSTLRNTAKGGTRERRRWSQAMVVLEIALSLMLLAGGGLTLKNLHSILNQHPGFDVDHVLRAVIDFPMGSQENPGARNVAIQQVLTGFREIPGVESAGYLYPQFFPYGGPRIRQDHYLADAAYFRTMHIPLLSGRLYQDTESDVTVLSRQMARLRFEGANPIGQKLRLRPNDSEQVTVIGIVGDVKNPVAPAPIALSYRPWPPSTPAGGIAMIRVTGDPDGYRGAIERELRRVNPKAEQVRIARLDEAVAYYVTPQRFVTSVLGIFALMGLSMASAGVYAVTRKWVSGRIPEFGMRRALGAQSRNLFLLVIRQASVCIGLGLAIGLVGTWSLQHSLASLLVGVSPTDPMVLGLVMCLLAIAAVVSAAGPALYAARVDPMAAIRHE